MDIDLESDYLEKLGEGDHRAFESLFIYYHPKVKGFLCGFVKDEEEASDMVQELFFRIWMNRKVISKVSSFQNYLFRMARNMVYDYFEHNLVKEKYERKAREESRVYGLDIIEEELYARELSLLIDMAIEKMPTQRRRIFIMSRKEGLSNEEIAVRLGINKRTVENHITQALSDLRKIILCFLIFSLKFL